MMAAAETATRAMLAVLAAQATASASAAAKGEQRMDDEHGQDGDRLDAKSEPRAE
jgi:hypothetical protein